MISHLLRSLPIIILTHDSIKPTNFPKNILIIAVHLGYNIITINIVYNIADFEKNFDDDDSDNDCISSPNYYSAKRCKVFLS